MTMPSGSSHATLWLHPARGLTPWKLRAASEDLREPALRNLVERAAAGLVLSEEPIPLSEDPPEEFQEDSSASSFLFGERLVGERLAVLVEGGNLKVCGKKKPHATTEVAPSKLSIPLLFADLIWAPVPEDSDLLDGGAGLTNMTPQYVLAVAPRPDKRSANVPAMPSGAPSWLKALPKKARPKADVFLICIGGCRDLCIDFQMLLLELGSRGAIRWDLEETYRLSRMVLGTGGCSSVHLGQFRFKATSREGQSGVEQPAAQVAAKCLDPGAQLNNEETVRSELSFLAQFGGHPHITSLAGLFCSSTEKSTLDEDDSQPVQLQWTIIMELCPLGDLTGLLKSDGALRQDEALKKMCGVLLALSHLHLHRVVHRDVKTDNILLSAEGQPLLADLGIAARIDDLEAMQRRVGTPGYVAPEVIDCKPYGVKADMFSAGVLLYVMLSNTPPFAGPDTQTVIRRTCKRSVKFVSSEFKDVQDSLKLLLQCLMSKEPEKRPTSTRFHGACLQLLPAPNRSPEEGAAGPYSPGAERSATPTSARDDPRFNPKSCLEQPGAAGARLLSVLEVDTPQSVATVQHRAPSTPAMGAVNFLPSVVDKKTATTVVEGDAQIARQVSPVEGRLSRQGSLLSESLLAGRNSLGELVRQARSNLAQLGRQALHRRNSSGSIKSSLEIGGTLGTRAAPENASLDEDRVFSSAIEDAPASRDVEVCSPNEKKKNSNNNNINTNNSNNRKQQHSNKNNADLAEEVYVQPVDSELEVLPVRPPTFARPAGSWYRSFKKKVPIKTRGRVFAAIAAFGKAD
ncbi:unnamed protein product [Polarella glacialis]|uniref:Protein kinase domain-containing protein n=1 Tax=Polarella glacialis TaxID=89957 RepID=A0A813I5V6_POLGL|nr:unnamed protein product [Polarella glacialis]